MQEMLREVVRMVKRFFHDDKNYSSKDDFIVFYLLLYYLLSIVRPNNQIYKTKLCRIKDRIRELKSLRSVNRIAQY